MSVSASTVRRALNSKYFHGRFPCKKPLIRKQNRIKRSQFAKLYVNKTKMFLKKYFLLMKVNLKFLELKKGKKFGGQEIQSSSRRILSAL